MLATDTGNKHTHKLYNMQKTLKFAVIKGYCLFNMISNLVFQMVQ